MRRFSSACLVIFGLAACGGGGSSPSSAGGSITEAPQFYIPLISYPNQGAAPGIFLINSNSLGSAPVRVASDIFSQATTVNPMAYTRQFTISAAGGVAGGSLETFVYSTAGATGGDYLWALDISPTSNMTPRQVGTVTISFFSGFCYFLEGFDNLNDPSSAFFIFDLATGPPPHTICPGTLGLPFSFALTHLRDSATTEPSGVPPLASGILPLYQPSGALGGFVALDTSNNLNFYPDESFANPTLLMPTGGSFSVLQAPGLALIPQVSIAPTFAFIVASKSASGPNSLYRIDSTGTMSADLYDFQNGLGSYGMDSNNLYFTDVAGAASNAIPETFLEVPLDGSSGALVLSSYAPPELGGPTTPYTYVGSTGMLLIMQRVSAPNGIVSSEIDSLPIGVPGTLTMLATIGGSIDAPTSSGDVFVSLASNPTSANGFPAYSTEIFGANGMILQPLAPHSDFIPQNPSGPLLQVKGITSSTGLGGGTIYAVNLADTSAPTATLLKSQYGSPFVFPDASGSASATSVSPTIGFVHVANSTPNLVLAYDLSKSLITTIGLPGSTTIVP